MSNDTSVDQTVSEFTVAMAEAVGRARDCLQIYLAKVDLPSYPATMGEFRMWEAMREVRRIYSGEYDRSPMGRDQLEADLWIEHILDRLPDETGGFNLKHKIIVFRFEPDLLPALEQIAALFAGSVGPRAGSKPDDATELPGDSGPTTLRGRLEFILGVFTTECPGPLQGREIGRKAQLGDDSRIRADLAELKRLGYLTHDGSGYRRTGKPYPCP